MNAPQDPNDALLARYLSYLAEPMGFDPHRPTAPEPARARAGKGTRESFRQASSVYRATRGVWDELRSTPLERIWAWSDLHLGHDNIIRFSGRPMKTIEQMNDQLLNAAQIVPPNDFLVFGGDMYVRRYAEVSEWMSMCPGRKLLIFGNHDKSLVGGGWKDIGFEAATPCLVQDIVKQASGPFTSPLVPGPLTALWWTHYPLSRSGIPPGVLNLHGHIHAHWLDGARLNLSVERHEYAPRRIADLIGMSRPQDAVSNSGPGEIG